MRILLVFIIGAYPAARLTSLLVAPALWLLPCHPVEQIHGNFFHMKANLARGVAVAHGNSPVFQRLEVDGDAVGSTDLILAAIATTDICHVVVLRNHQALQFVMQRLRS